LPLRRSDGDGMIGEGGPNQRPAVKKPDEGPKGENV
jgi:hypothetical protein